MSRPTPSLTCLLVALSFLACGKKGDPQPPILQVPAQTRDLSVVQRGDRLLVELGYPQTTAAGTPLAGGLTAVTLSELVVPVPSGAPAAGVEVDDRRFGAGARPVVVLEGADLTSAVHGDRIRFTAPAPVIGAESDAAAAVAALAVTTRGPGGRESALSARVAYPLVDPPSPPTGVEAVAESRGVSVRWEHPLLDTARDAATDTTEDDSSDTAAGGEDEATADPTAPAFAGFNLYRRRATERSYGPPVRSVGPRADRVVDGTAVFGERYIYAVTAVASRQPVTVESVFAEEVEVDYRDRFAPPAPRRLVALSEGRQVRLVWEASEADDLAGYRVYRRGPDTQEFEPLAEEPVTTTGTTDRELSPGATYTYRVTAVDRLGNESEPSATATAEIR